MCEQCERSVLAAHAAEKGCCPGGARDTLVIGVLLSGSGSNLQAIIDAIDSGRLNARIAVVISNRNDAFGLERARKAGIEAVFLDPLQGVTDGRSWSNLSDNEKANCSAEYNTQLRDILLESGVEYVVMAGYMRLLGTEVLKAFPMRVLNLHPALLPSFPGAHGITDALAYGVKVTGVTVHFADEVFDRGPIIAQQAVRVLEGDTEETLARRIHEVEHELYPYALGLIAEGRLRLDGRRVTIVTE